MCIRDRRSTPHLQAARSTSLQCSTGDASRRPARPRIAASRIWYATVLLTEAMQQRQLCAAHAEHRE
eukprot:10918538-Alexandrium_andersonii.AAC.1